MPRVGYERSVPKSLPLRTLTTLGLALFGCQSKPLRPIAAETGGGAGEMAAAAGEATGGAPDGVPPGVRQRVLDDARISSDQAADDFQHAAAEIDFGSEPVARAALYFDLRSPCFPFSNWAKLGVPSGQRWPEPCDAFDRTVQVTLDEPENTSDGIGLELLRAITPFGGPEHLEADVTNVVNGLPGKHRLVVHIDTWSDAAGLVSGAKGEWYASVTLETWAGAAPRRVLAVLPVVFEAQTEPDSAPVTFEAPSGAGSALLEYRATGHGGVNVFNASCRGPAEEFCRRDHELLLDGEVLAQLEPWRDDCDALCTVTQNDGNSGPQSYCAENPCGDQNSVRAPRANWCPGSATPPFVIEHAALAQAGKHELLRSIPELEPGGKWTVSATYFAFE